MPVLGITGGVATGKSAFTQTLRRNISAEVFDADVEARAQMNDPVIKQRLRDELGDAIFTNGEIDRVSLRQIAFTDPARRRLLEQILHPAIREQWLRRVQQIGATEWLLVDIPLLFETAAEKFFDAIIVIACPASTQLARLTSNRHLDLDLAKQIISAQMPLSEKVTRADHVIWNDGTLHSLERQSALVASSLQRRYG